MAYYLVVDNDIRGPYTNKDQVIQALGFIVEFYLADSKREAKEYLEDAGY
jgi:hypothetical protein